MNQTQNISAVPAVSEPLLTFQLSESGEPQSSKHNNKTCRITVIALVVFIILAVIVTVIIIVVVVFSSSSSPSTNIKFDKYLIVISLDGFRSEYFENTNISSPNLHEIAENGVQIKRLIPVYPSYTFPNHYSIATGLYPGDHGIVNNFFWDPVLNEQFFMWTNDEKGEWYRGLPIWITHRTEENINNFSDYKTATSFWVGSDHNVSGKGYPDWYLRYNGSVTYQRRIDNILDLLRDGEYRLIMSYFEGPDKEGHKYGPQSIEVKQAIEYIDGLIGYLINGIKEISIDLYDRTDIIITSDHGMTDVSNQTVIHINDTSEFNLSDTNNFILDDKSSNLLIKLTEFSNYTTQDIIDRLQDIIYPIDLVKIYDRNTIPFKYSNNGYHKRIPDVMILPPVGYLFMFDNMLESQQWWLTQKGGHGFNNTHIDMSALFVAQGPSFKKDGYIKDMTENIHLYELFCYIMDEMIPSPNNGSLAEIQDILA